MQRVTNCILKQQDQVLLLKKPSRGWYAMPGGKIEQGESLTEAVVREYREETGLHLIDPSLRGVFTMVKIEDDVIQREWMMFTFLCEVSQGEIVDFCKEGELEWVPIDNVLDKPMAPSDRYIHRKLLFDNKVTHGIFNYTTDYQLLNHKLE